MKIEDTQYGIIMTKEFIEKIPFDIAVWFARQAAKSLDASCWDNNYDVLLRDKVEEEGLDCYFIPVGDFKSSMVIEAVPLLPGLISLQLRDDLATLPYATVVEGNGVRLAFKPHCVCISPSAMKKIPVKTAAELFFVPTPVQKDVRAN